MIGHHHSFALLLAFSLICLIKAQEDGCIGSANYLAVFDNKNGPHHQQHIVTLGVKYEKSESQSASGSNKTSVTKVGDEQQQSVASMSKKNTKIVKITYNRDEKENKELERKLNNIDGAKWSAYASKAMKKSDQATLTLDVPPGGSYKVHQLVITCGDLQITLPEMVVTGDAKLDDPNEKVTYKDPSAKSVNSKSIAFGFFLLSLNALQ